MNISSEKIFFLLQNHWDFLLLVKSIYTTDSNYCSILRYSWHSTILLSSLSSFNPSILIWSLKALLFCFNPFVTLGKTFRVEYVRGRRKRSTLLNPTRMSLILYFISIGSTQSKDTPLLFQPFHYGKTMPLISSYIRVMNV